MACGMWQCQPECSLTVHTTNAKRRLCGSLGCQQAKTGERNVCSPLSWNLLGCSAQANEWLVNYLATNWGCQLTCLATIKLLPLLISGAQHQALSAFKHCPQLGHDAVMNERSEGPHMIWLDIVKQALSTCARTRTHTWYSYDHSCCCCCSL